MTPHPGVTGQVASVNLARVSVSLGTQRRPTGIDKIPTDAGAMVRSPGPTGSGLVGDTIGNQKLHGGDDQAVYAYAREDLDGWEAELARPITNGMFGENLTTVGVDVTRARIGERWRIGTDGLVLEVSAPRTPCRTFAAFVAAPAFPPESLRSRPPDRSRPESLRSRPPDQWIKIFTRAAKPGAYLRVISPGAVRAGDAIALEHRPDHDVTIEMAFRARMSEPDLLPKLLVADALSADLKAYAGRMGDR